VQFWVLPEAGRPGSLLDTDSDLSNGAAITVTFSPGLVGRVAARALLGGNIIAESNPVGLVVKALDPTPVPLPPANTVKVEPVIQYQDGVYVVAANSAVTLSWPDMPAQDLVQVEFVLVAGGGGAGISLGIDADLADGASLAWTVPAGTVGSLLASARLPGEGGEVVQSEVIGIRAQ
jgi:hypothetical protein